MPSVTHFTKELNLYLELNRAMNTWKYYGITHRNHLVCNPTSEAKLAEFVGILPLDTNAHVLDIACGKGEQLVRVVKRHNATGVGVDISPYEVEEARLRVAQNNLQDRIEIIEGDGGNFTAAPNTFSLAMCIGASWIRDGYFGTIEALKSWVQPGGLIAIGEPFKLKEPDAEFVAVEPGLATNLVWHHENVAVAQRAGLIHLYSMVSNQDDWDRYESLNMLSAESYAVENPDDPDIEELLDRRRRDNKIYLKWGRDTINWAIYLFRAP